MKKFKSLVLAVIGLLCSLSLSAEDFEVDGIYYDITSSKDMTVAVTYRGYDYNSYSNEYSGAVKIPESVIYNGSIYSVTSIGDDAFFGCSGLTSVVIGNNVTTIGRNAFFCCSDLTSVVIGNNVTTIGQNAFYGCSALTSVVIPNSVTSIGIRAFTDCSGLTSLVVAPDNPIYDSREGCNAIVKTSSNELLFGCQFTIIPNSVTSIGEEAFFGCYGLTSVVIPNCVTSIGRYAFYGCSGLTSVVIPNGVTSIGDGTFGGCRGVTSVVIPNTVTSIGSFAFDNCLGLTSVVIPNSVTSIGVRAFEYCDGLTSVVIPNSVTSIGDDAFYNCDGLTSVVIPNSVTSIGNEAFYDCNNLKVVLNNSNFTFEKGSSSYGYIAYYATVVCNGYEQVDDFIFTEEDGACSLRLYVGNETELVLPANYKGDNYGIGEYAFHKRDGLTSVVFPNSVTSIGSYAFQGCDGFTSVVIPNSVTSIGSSAFRNCSGLTSLTIGTGVLSIGSNQCTPKKTIWLTNTPPSGWGNLKGTINYVANEQYGSSSNVKVYPYLSSMFETDGVKYVPVSPSERTCDAIDCNYDSAVEEINIGETVSYRGVAMTVKNVMPYAAYGHKIVKQLSLSHKGEVGASAFYGCTGITTLTLGDGITFIGESAFRECSSLSEVKIPKKVIELGNYCFANTALESISIPASVTRIGSYAFDDCTKMTDVVIEDRTADLSLGSNGSSPLFSDCPLDSVYIGGNITYNTSSSYGYSPFYRNTSLRSVVITDKEEEISDNEFYGCTSLKNVTIGSDVKKIGNWAFCGCSNLTKLISYAEVPPTCGTMALDDINKWNCVLQVPQSCLAAYQQADQWKEFFFIEDVLTAIGGVTVDGAVPATADVYSTNGMLIKRNAELKNLKHELPAGIYIIGGKKVWVK